MSSPMTPATDLPGIRRQIHEFVALNFLFDGSGGAFDDDTSLVEQGIVDPTGFLELALFIEEGWGVTVAEADLGPENFDTVAALATYVKRHLPPA
ncbi:MAG TPA: acyl carrier protein [Ktedonobacterales bacterium]